MPRAFSLVATIACALLLQPQQGLAQEDGGPLPSPEPLPATTGHVWPALKSEAGIFASDAAAFAVAPLHWERGDWERAAGFAAVLGGLLAADRGIDKEAQEQRSSFSDHVSSATVRFGAEGAMGVSALLLADGLVFHDANTRDMGREALESSLISGLLVNLVLKPVFGRERPGQSGGRIDFDLGSSSASFPSGHATEAFSVASVIAARSRGWLVPTAAYTLATVVALDRINGRAHFTSDVFAGAVLGTVTGRFLVARHRGPEPPDRLSWGFGIAPRGHGLLATIYLRR